MIRAVHRIIWPSCDPFARDQYYGIRNMVIHIYPPRNEHILCWEKDRKGTSSSNWPFVGDMLVPLRVLITKHRPAMKSDTFPQVRVILERKNQTKPCQTWGQKIYSHKIGTWSYQKSSRDSWVFFNNHLSIPMGFWTSAKNVTKSPRCRSTHQVHSFDS